VNEGELFEAFARRPEDLHLRSVYADWLEERGDLWRANFVRLWVKTAPLLELRGWYRETRELRSQSYFFDREWQRRVFDPPIPLAPRTNRRWLAAVLGGDEDRAAMREEAPPSLLEDAVFGTNLLWGWPSALLFRLASAAVRDAIEACALTMSDLPRTQLLAVVARIEEAAAAGESRFDAERRPPGERSVAYDLAIRLPDDLASMLRPYQARTQEESRPAAIASAVHAAAHVREQLGWAARGFARKHAAKEQAVKVAAAAAVRAEKAARALASAPPRLEASGMRRGEIARTLGALAARRDRAHAIAADAKARADALVAACPSAPTFHGELRALLARIAPGLVAWLRAQPGDFASEVLVRGLVEEQVDPYNTVWRVTYGEDGRASVEWVSSRR
jgi:uncharacterized protein (TIGR02996 family)